MCVMISSTLGARRNSAEWKLLRYVGFAVFFLKTFIFGIGTDSPLYEGGGWLQT